MKVAHFGLFRENEFATCNHYGEQVKEYCDSHDGYEFVGDYKDYEGKGQESKAFQELKTDCQNGKVDYIVIYKFSRLGRNTLKAVQAIKEMKELKVGIYFVDTKIDTLKNDIWEQITA